MNGLKPIPSNLRPFKLRVLCHHATVAAVTIVSLTQPVSALDSSRALTQSIHRIWQTQQGLPQGTIYCVYQTQDRYLLLGTKTGLVRFDGVQFTVVRNLGAVSLGNVWVRQLYQDAQRTIWIATDDDGLVRWKDGEATRFSKSNGLPSNSVRCLYADSQQNVWIG